MAPMKGGRRVNDILRLKKKDPGCPKVSTEVDQYIEEIELIIRNLKQQWT